MKFPVVDAGAKRVLIKEYNNDLGKIRLYAEPSWPCYESGYMNWTLCSYLVTDGNQHEFCLLPPKDET